MPEVRGVKTEEEEEEAVGRVVVEELEVEMSEVGDLRTVFEVEIPEEEDHRKVAEAAEAEELMTVHGVEAEKAGLAIKNPPKESQKKTPKKKQ
jgi:hypothetical protein